MSGTEGQIVAMLLVGSLVLGAPLFIGIELLVQRNKTPLGWYAALLTLKPLVATPLWFLIFTTNLLSDGLGILLMFPGAGLTVLLAVAYRNVFFDYETSDRAWRLLALDCARWITSGLWALIAAGFNTGPSSSGMTVCICIIALAALALPTIFAFVALATVGAELSRVEK